MGHVLLGGSNGGSPSLSYSAAYSLDPLVTFWNFIYYSNNPPSFLLTAGENYLSHMENALI